MFCEKCGNQMDDNAKVCPNCGEPVAKIEGDLGLGGNVVTIGGEQPQEAPAAAATDVEKKVKILSIVAIACGVAGFLFSFITVLLAFPLAIAGIICGILAIKSANDAKISKTLPIIGLVAAIAGPVVGFIVSFIVGFIIGLIAAAVA